MFAFLNTIILSALGLALIPVIIHLLNRRKSVKVPFSSLRFLKILQKKQIKNIKIRQIILLILRTLILLLLVLAFARPAWRSAYKPAIEAHEKTSVILVLDHSMSTAAVTGQGMVLDRIKARANEIVDQFREGDEAVILAAPGFGGNEPQDFSRQISELRAGIKSLEPVCRPSLLANVMERAAELMKKARNPNREIIVISDLQKNDFEDAALQNLKHERSQVPVQWLFINMSPGDYRNAGVDTVSIMSRIIEKTKPVTVKIKIRNYSINAPTELSVRMFFNGKKVQQQTITVPQNDASEIEMTAIPGASGFVNGKIEIDDDQLMQDNQYYFGFYVPEVIHTLLVQPKPSSYKFIELALLPSSRFQTAVNVRSLSSAGLSAVNWNDFDAIVFSNHPSFDAVQIQQMENFLKKGKGVLIIPGRESDVKSYSDKLFAHFGLGNIRPAADYSATKEQSVLLGEINFTHPVLRGIYERKVSGPLSGNDSPRFYRFWPTDLSGFSQPLIQYSNRYPFLFESRVGAGRLLLMTSAIDLEWNDLPLRGLFPPLLHRSLQYLYAQSQAPVHTGLCGKSAEFRIGRVLSDLSDIRDESGREFKPKVKSLGDETLIHIPGFDNPGHYRITDKNQTVVLLSVNHHSDESVQTVISYEDLRSLFSGQAVDVIGSSESLQDYILTSRMGYELWKWLLIIAVFCLLAEVLISQSHRLKK